MKFCPKCGLEMECFSRTIRGNSIETKRLADEFQTRLPWKVNLYVCKPCNHRETEPDAIQTP